MAYKVKVKKDKGRDERDRKRDGEEDELGTSRQKVSRM